MSRYYSESEDHGVHKVKFLSLYLDKTNLRDEGLCAFIESLDGVCHFNELSLSDNSLHASGVASLADAVCSRKLVLRGSIPYDRFNLRDNPLGLEGCVAVSRMLGSDHCRSCVDLSKCKLTTDGAGLTDTDSLNGGSNTSDETIRIVRQKICKMPQSKWNTITWLSLDGNSFTGEAIHILGSFMYLCPSLNEFSSSDCGITSDDLSLLLTQLKSSSPSLCSELMVWYLDDNEIDDSGVRALQDNNYLQSYSYCKVSLFNNPISSGVKSQLKWELDSSYDVRWLLHDPLT